MLLKNLHHYGVKGIALDWFINYQCNRSQFVKIQDFSSDLLNITCGVPHGSILGSLLLFIVYINDTINASTLVTFILFVDDKKIYFKYKCLKTLYDTDELNDELNKNYELNDELNDEL